jgi:hypothetical protein
MASTIFTAPQYDPAKDKRRTRLIWTIILVVIFLALLAWFFRYWPQEHLVSRFFQDLQNKDFEAAYGLWVADKDWKQHPDKFTQYPFREFYQDWGPAGEWGPIRSYKVEGAAHPSGGSGVVVVVTVNDRVDPKARIWVESKDKTLTFSPY